MGKPYEGKASHNDKPRYDKKRPFHKKHKHENKPAFAGQPRRDDADRFAKPAFTKPAFDEGSKGPQGPKKPKKNKKAKHRQNPMIAGSNG